MPHNTYRPSSATIRLHYQACKFSSDHTVTAPAPVVVTSCTSRKRGSERAVTLQGLEGASSVDALSRAWLARVRTAAPTRRACSLYVGRAFAEARQAASRLGASLHVVSAGLGLVAGEAAVPRYDATISGKDAELQACLAGLGASASYWWLALNSGPAIARLLTQSGLGDVLLALPSTYIALVSADLAEVRPKDVPRLRIFTSEIGMQALPGHLRDAWMPYDSRLESVQGWSGTQADFPQRALGHFVETFGPARLGQAAARQAVHQALGPLASPFRVTRIRLDDSTLKAWVRSNWDLCGGSTSRLLTRLRHDAGHACEQGRFAQLCREVRASKKDRPHAHA